MLTATQEITGFIAVTLFMASLDAYIVWYHQDVFRILFTIGLNFILLMAYSIARDAVNGSGNEALPQDGPLEKSSESAQAIKT
jgi:hypothetical protein